MVNVLLKDGNGYECAKLVQIKDIFITDYLSDEISLERGSTWPIPYIGFGTLNNHPGQYENV